MKNPNWYYHCDLARKVALEYTQLPEFYGNMGSINDFTDETLADLSFAVPNRGFLRPDAAVKAGIEELSMKTARAAAEVLVLDDLRAQRDHLLSVTDIAATVDRWNSLDSVAQRKITEYRQKLRDITDQPNIFNVVWPLVPQELSFVHVYEWPEDIPLSDALRATLDHPVTMIPIEQVRADQAQRVLDLRDKRISGGVAVNGHWFQTDTNSLVQYLALLAAGDTIPSGIRWKTMDGTFIDVTPALVRGVYAAAMTMNNATYTYAETLRARVLAAPKPDTVDITKGWPLIYGEAA